MGGQTTDTLLWYWTTVKPVGSTRRSNSCSYNINITAEFKPWYIADQKYKLSDYIPRPCASMNFLRLDEFSRLAPCRYIIYDVTQIGFGEFLTLVILAVLRRGIPVLKPRISINWQSLFPTCVTNKWTWTAGGGRTRCSCSEHAQPNQPKRRYVRIFDAYWWGFHHDSFYRFKNPFFYL